MPWSILGPLAVGFVKGFVAEMSKPPPSGYDFRGHMRHLAQRTGCELNGVKGGRVATFLIGERRERVVAAVLLPPAIVLRVFSTIQFPGGIPREIMSGVFRHNATSDLFEYKVMDMDDQSVFFIETAIGDASALTPTVFQKLVTPLAEMISSVDESLAEAGFGG